MENEIKAISILILGWLFGLLSPSITNFIQDKRKAEKMKKSLLSELGECQINMANIVYLIESRYIAISHNLLDYLIKIYENYRGVNDYKNMISRLKNLKNLSEEQLNIESKKELYENFDKFLSLKKYDLPYLKSKIDDIQLFEESFQKNLLQLMFKLNLFNSEIEESKFHYQLTFSSEVSEENKTINKKILRDRQLIVLEQSKQIIALISKIQ